METVPITTCLLDVSNTTAVGDATVASILMKKEKLRLWDDRPAPTIDTAVIHYISAAESAPDNPFDFVSILKIFCDLVVSSHYLIDRAGRIYLLVPENKRAWHCGGSVMPAPDGRTNVNDFSIGIELVATQDSGFTSEQYSCCARLIRSIEKRLQTSLARVGHQDIAGDDAVRRGLRADIKRDPGAHFDWRHLAKLITSFS